MAGRIITVDLAIDQSSIYKVIDMPTKELLTKTVEEFEKENPLYHLYNFKSLGQLQETYTSSVGSDRIKKQTAEMAIAEIGQGGQEGFSGSKTYRMYSGSYQITKRAILEAKQSGNFNAIAYNTADRTKTWLRNNVEDGVRAILGAFGTTVKGDDGTPYRFITTDTVDGKTGQYAVNSARNDLFSKKHTLVRKSDMAPVTVADAALPGYDAALSQWKLHDGTIAPVQSNIYIAQNQDNTYGIDLLGDDPGKIAKLADLINVIVTNMENQLDDNGKPAGLHGPKEIVGPNDARLVAALNSALNEPMHKGFGDQSIPNPAYKRISKCNHSVYWNTIEALYNKSAQRAIGFFIVDKAYMAANNGLELTQRFPLEVTSEEHKNPAYLDVIFSEGMEFNCLTWRGITYVCINPEDQTNMFTIPANISGTGSAVNIPITAATPVEVIDTIVKPVSIVGRVETDPTINVTGITTSPTTKAFTAAGQTQQLTNTIAPTNADNKAVLYFSSNTAVATVSSTGLITAVGAGSSTITVVTKDGGYSATCAVTVTIQE